MLNSPIGNIHDVNKPLSIIIKVSWINAFENVQFRLDNEDNEVISVPTKDLMDFVKQYKNGDNKSKNMIKYLHTIKSSAVEN